MSPEGKPARRTSGGWTDWNECEPLSRPVEGEFVSEESESKNAAGPGRERDAHNCIARYIQTLREGYPFKGDANVYAVGVRRGADDLEALLPRLDTADPHTAAIQLHIWCQEERSAHLPGNEFTAGLRSVVDDLEHALNRWPNLAAWGEPLESADPTLGTRSGR